jgi:hypothetical protein
VILYLDGSLFCISCMLYPLFLSVYLMFWYRELGYRDRWNFILMHHLYFIESFQCPMLVVSTVSRYTGS